MLLLVITVFSCKQEKDNAVPVDETISTTDLSATNAMRSDLGNMQQTLDSLLATPHHTQQLHWDSLYHYHDSLFWHHHNDFQHDHYTHDDHHHSWTDYDSHIDHAHHFHHVYPGHEHDSLVTTHNAHTDENSDHHYAGHDFHDHHILDSFHAIHNAHHP